MESSDTQAGGSGGMTTYVALLRGINVGGHRKIKMADLKGMFEALGFGAVRTYIQSGNVICRAVEAEEPLRQRIEQQIAATFGFPVTVVLRTADEMARLIAACPYAPDALQEDENLYVALLPDAPDPQGIARLLAVRSEPDECRIIGREVYLLYRRSARDTLLSNNFLESRLGVSATSRNWRTITTLAGMSAESSPGLERPG